MSVHSRTVCSCGMLISSCRCPGPHVSTIAPDSCPSCKAKAQASDKPPLNIDEEFPLPDVFTGTLEEFVGDRAVVCLELASTARSSRARTYYLGAARAFRTVAAYVSERGDGRAR